MCSFPCSANCMVINGKRAVYHHCWESQVCSQAHAARPCPFLQFRLSQLFNPAACNSATPNFSYHSIGINIFLRNHSERALLLLLLYWAANHSSHLMLKNHICIIMFHLTAHLLLIVYCSHGHRFTGFGGFPKGNGFYSRPLARLSQKC